MQKRFFQLPVTELVRQTLERNQGTLADNGALVIHTGRFTGRSPDDKFIVLDDLTEYVVDWNKFNNQLNYDCFMRLKKDITRYLDAKKEIWTRYVFAAARHSIALHIINEFPAHNHFAANMFIEPVAEQLETMEPEWTVYHAPGFVADPLIHGTKSGNFAVISFSRKVILIGGTAYTGEIKKSVFTVINFLFPLEHNTLSMHCSANKGADGDVSLFFGLSGTGKTTLSSDPDRVLIGDDEHGWDHTGVFNFEGGCYAKIINLSEQQEPIIYNAIKPGALVENTCFLRDSFKIDYQSSAVTENTRVSFPLNFVSRTAIMQVHESPRNIFFLSCDAYGVLPPISKLSPAQAAEFYLLGYTAKVAGTEAGVTVPKAVFSPCFGAPFIPLCPAFYAKMLQKKLQSGNINIWLVNTGWSGGTYGIGHRIPLDYTRQMISAALDGTLEKSGFQSDPVFDLAIPAHCPGVPREFLEPWLSWTEKQSYFEEAEKLKQQFETTLNAFPLSNRSANYCPDTLNISV